MYSLRFFSADIKLVVYGLVNNITDNNFFYTFKESPFFYWTLFNKTSGFYGFKKHFIKNEIIVNLLDLQ